ncbi:hypothetical protein T484DRAFT_1743461 [Baffinella frigidus]|nr:hypothetical protein T484DRAFT_1743461 [Cryptophyta sp. CCMP2293]
MSQFLPPPLPTMGDVGDALYSGKGIRSQKSDGQLIPVEWLASASDLVRQSRVHPHGNTLRLLYGRCPLLLPPRTALHGVELNSDRANARSSVGLWQERERASQKIQPTLLNPSVVVRRDEMGQGKMEVRHCLPPCCTTAAPCKFQALQHVARGA